MKVWMLCEAFTLTGDAFGHQTVHESLTAWGLPCASRKAAMRELRQCVRERVIENYEGLDDADDDIRSDIDAVMASRKWVARRRYIYRYSASDREVVWEVYPCEIMQ